MFSFSSIVSSLDNSAPSRRCSSYVSSCFGRFYIWKMDKTSKFSVCFVALIAYLSDFSSINTYIFDFILAVQFNIIYCLFPPMTRRIIAPIPAGYLIQFVYTLLQLFYIGFALLPRYSFQAFILYFICHAL